MLRAPAPTLAARQARAAWRRVSHATRAGSAFAFFFGYGAFLAHAVLPVARLAPGSPDAKARRCRRIVGRQWRMYFSWLRRLDLLRYHPRPASFTLPDGPAVVVANHPTLLDVAAIGATHPDLVVVAKAAVYRSRSLGRLLQACGHIEGGDGSLFSGAAVIEEAVATLRDGTKVLIFPEGTRSPAGGLGAFHAGCVQIAALADVPLVPLALTCEPPTLTRGEPWYALPPEPATLTIEALPALEPPFGRTGATLRRLRAAYARHLGLDAEPTPESP